METLSSYVKHTLEHSSDSYAMPIYGSVCYLAEYLDKYGFDTEEVMDCLLQVLRNAKIFCPHRKPSKIAKCFSHLLKINPDIMELYLGFSLTEFDKSIEKPLVTHYN